MAFTSFTFLAFWLLFAAVYLFAPQRVQKYLLLAGNLVFYLWTGLFNGVILAVGITVGYFCARGIERGKRARLLLALGQVAALGTLFVFKYTDFLFGTLGLPLTGLAEWQPIGISFYTFAMSGYLFDVYRGKVAAERNYVRFAAFVSFFPAILSGPIGQARSFLPQLRERQTWDTERVKRGLLRFVLGCFKKLVLADGIGLLVDAAYDAPWSLGSGVWLAVVLAYSFRIYWDFSAYSDMAIGVGTLLGFRMTENFDRPYFSASVKEFWKKWHISLTSWFREYLYFPLGGSRVAKMRCMCNILIVFAVSGLWHGASFTFLVWGLLNGLYQVVGQLTLPMRERAYARLHWDRSGRAARLWQTAVTFGLITVSWIFFRAESLSQASWIIRRILLVFRDGLGLSTVSALGLSMRSLLTTVVLGALYTVFELLQKHRRVPDGLTRTTVRYTLVVLLLLGMISLFGTYGNGVDAQTFVYFRF